MNSVLNSYRRERHKKRSENVLERERMKFIYTDVIYFIHWKSNTPNTLCTVIVCAVRDVWWHHTWFKHVRCVSCLHTCGRAFRIKFTQSVNIYLKKYLNAYWNDYREPSRCPSPLAVVNRPVSCDFHCFPIYRVPFFFVYRLLVGLFGSYFIRGKIADLSIFIIII